MPLQSSCSRGGDFNASNAFFCCMKKDEELLYKRIGKRITDLRKKAGYTNQEAFAYDVGIARGQYTRYEVGSNMKLSSLHKILKFHKLTIYEFFDEGFE